MELSTLTLGLGGGAVIVRALQRWREHRPGPAGLADRLLWGFMVDDGVILQKDGSLLAGWRYRGPDLAAATAHELTVLARHVNDALLPFADRWVFHVDAIRRPATAYAVGNFPDPVTQLIDDERRAAYSKRASQQFETEYVWVATYLPPAQVVSRVAQLFIQQDGHTDLTWSKELVQFAVALHGLETILGGRLNFQRLDSDGLLTHLHECLTGLSHPVRTPPHGSYLDYVLADKELLGGFEPMVGRRAIRAVAVQGYPNASHAGQLDVLNTLPFAFRWSNRIIPLGQREAAKAIRRQQLQWFRKRKGASAWMQEMVENKRGADRRPADDDLFIDQDARRMTEDAADAAGENASGAVRFCAYTQVLIVADPDPAHADHVASEILKQLNDAGFTGRTETVNALEAYLGSLPGHGYPNLRRPLLSTRNIADLLPVTSVWPGLAYNPSPIFPALSPPLLWAATGGATPFRVNLHDSDVGHTLVVGKTGAGKSVLLGLLAAQFRRYPGAQLFVFDVGYSAWLLAHAAGAKHYDLAAGRADALRFQPLARIDEPAERAWVADWLEIALHLQGLTMTPPIRERLDHALALVARNAPGHRTLTELSVQLQHDGLVGALRPYTVAGNYGQLLDADRDDLEDGSYQVFEMKHLLALDDKIALPVLLYLFRRIEQRLDGRPTLIEIDEAWMALMHSLFGAKVNEWLLQLRKSNAAVVLATQSLSQLERLPNRHTIVDSCVTKIYLPNADAATPSQAGLYRDLGLNEREIGLVARAVPKRDYYFKSPRGSRVFELALGPIALAFLATPVGFTVESTKRRVETLITEHRGNWVGAWLMERGLEEEAEHLDWAMPTDAHTARMLTVFAEQGVLPL